MLRKNHKIPGAIAAIAAMVLVCCGAACAEQWRLLFGLEGRWKFEIGDDSARAEYRFDDSGWETINAPSPWEDQGFPGYDGFAWYRKHFFSNPDWNSKTLSVELGTVDDVDEVYINGHYVGSTGDFPPRYVSAWNIMRQYQFSTDFLNPSGDNVIAVRVYDDQLNGGITNGPLGIYEDRESSVVRIPITKGWKFALGDNPEWKNEHISKADWKPITVPAYWETQGYRDYDGFAWYRVTFGVPAALANDQWILLLGKIDDFDETFINGTEIGHTGAIMSRHPDVSGTDAYAQLRAYTIPKGCLHPEGNNVLAVRVYDGYKDGGIYAGPIGLVNRDDFSSWQRKQRRPKSFFDWLDWLFR